MKAFFSIVYDQESVFTGDALIHTLCSGSLEGICEAHCVNIHTHAGRRADEAHTFVFGRKSWQCDNH